MVLGSYFMLNILCLCVIMVASLMPGLVTLVAGTFLNVELHNWLCGYHS